MYLFFSITGVFFNVFFMNNFKIQRRGKNLVTLFFLFFVWATAGWAMDNSQIYFEGPSEAITPESDFTVNVLVDAKEPVNALDLEISYPKDKLKFLTFDNTDSIVDIWQAKPALLPDGNIVLTGGIFKSFAGEKGLIIKLSFRALNTGQSKLFFAKSSLYIADGKGTKLSMSSLTSTISITENETSASLPKKNKEKMLDNSPPEILLEQTTSPVDGSSLIVFHATDSQSGIKQTQMRIKKWGSFSDWQDVQNPVLYPAGAWQIELRAINNAGLEAVKSISRIGELYKKIIIPFFLFFILMFIVIWVYNNSKRKL